MEEKRRELETCAVLALATVVLLGLLHGRPREADFPLFFVIGEYGSIKMIEIARKCKKKESRFFDFL